MAYSADLLRCYQSGGLEHLHVLLDAGEGHREISGEFADSCVGLAESFENAATSRIGERSEGGIELWRILNHIVQCMEP